MNDDIQAYNEKLNVKELNSLNFYDLADAITSQTYDGYKLFLKLNEFIINKTILNRSLINVYDSKINFYNNKSSLIFFVTFFIQLIIFLILQSFEIISERRKNEK